MRSWVSWIQKTHDYRPLTDPPAEGCLGWWCSGYDADDNAILCALVDSGFDPAEVIRASWPEFDSWMFNEKRPSNWVPGDRFVRKPWMWDRMGEEPPGHPEILATQL